MTMDRLDPTLFSYIHRTDGVVIERRDLQAVQPGDVLRIATKHAKWLIEVSGHNEEGCVEGSLTFVAENPLKLHGLSDFPAMEPIVQAPVVVGSFLTPDFDGLIMDAVIPGRSPLTSITTSDVTNIMRFPIDQL